MSKISEIEIFQTKKLGKGSYGHVNLGKYIKTNKYVAVKIISKREVSATDGVYRLKYEKESLILCRKFPFIVEYYGCGIDDEHIYFIMEYIQGGTLYWHKIRNLNKHFTVEVCKFYSAELILILEYLHDHCNIHYADLKPENLMIDSNGHLKLIDMGSSRLLSSKDERRKSICGTPIYSAPEVLSQSSHSKPADMWSFGAVLLLLLF